MINYKEELNSEQLEVVMNGDGACLVLAGAGSGKTRTVTFRVAYLLEQGVRPDEILLVTFTNKAAREMKERVRELTNGEAALPWSGTFHHIAFRLLKQYAPLLGYKQNFTILDRDDSRDLLKICMKLEGMDKAKKRYPSTAVMQSIISFARNAERTIEDVLDEKHPKWLDIADQIGRIAEEYRKRKLEANAMDFDDLLVNLHLLLLKSPNTKQRFAEQFRYIMVDEYQDTNKVQASIIDLFASVHKNILVVGDDAQSIYSFRAADIQNILSFENTYPNARVFRLETNYRSTPEILSVANEVIANNSEQYQKELRSMQDAFVKPEVRAFADQLEEAQFIAERILELQGEGVPLGHIAVLFRAAFHTQALEMELAKRDIPYEFRGGTRFFDRAHIKDALAYLRIIANPEDVVAWSRVLNMQVGIGPVSAQKVITEIQVRNRQLLISKDEAPEKKLKQQDELLEGLGGLLSARGQVGWNDFLQIWEILTAPIQSGDQPQPAELIQGLLESKYVDYLESQYPDYRERVQDLEQLALFAEREQDIQKFLAETTLQENFTLAAAQRDAVVDDEEKIVLSTIHQAKGLEWEAVFVMHVAAGQFPNERALKERHGIEEERRLFYVAVTRAKKQLYLSYPITSGRSMILGGPSVFLEEIDRELVDEYNFSSSGWGSDAGLVFSDLNDDSEDITYVAEDEPFPSNKKPPRSFLMDVDEF